MISKKALLTILMDIHGLSDLFEIIVQNLKSLYFNFVKLKDFPII